MERKGISSLGKPMSFEVQQLKKTTTKKDRLLGAEKKKVKNGTSKEGKKGAGTGKKSAGRITANRPSTEKGTQLR